MLAGPPVVVKPDTLAPSQAESLCPLGGQSLQKAQEDQLALDALDHGHRDLAPGGYTVACPPWSLREGPLDSKGPFSWNP